MSQGSNQIDNYALVNELRASLQAIANVHGRRLEEILAAHLFAAPHMGIGGPKLAQLVLRRDYAGLNCYLTTNAFQVDDDVTVSLLRMAEGTGLTGLEWAVWKSDWKLLALFFVHGADPANNAFNGQTRSRSQTVVTGFDADDPQPVPGFAGLRLLAAHSQVGREGRACLHLLEFLRCNSRSLHREYATLADSVTVLARDLRYTAGDLEAHVLSSLLTLRRMGLPRETALPIVEAAVRGTLWSKLEAFATRED